MSPSRWHAPREDGATLVVPTWQELPGLIEANRRDLEQSELRWGDRSLADVRELAWQGASQQVSKWAEEIDCTQPHPHPTLPHQGGGLRRPLIVTGHQPELFHPGVWAKNIAISKLAKQLGGSSLNLNVDSDVAKSTSLKLPVTEGDGYDLAFRFGQTNPPLPYEEWTCDDEAAFAGFPTVLAPVLKSWPWQPVLPSFWTAAIGAGSQTKNLPERWIIARRHWERSHGIDNHELAMSRWCRTEFFSWLVGQFVSDHERFASIYNDELKKYRKEHRIRSANHPVADLLVNADLTELPFWVWREGTTQRGRLCARKTGQLIALIAGKETLVTHDSGDWKIRPKALITSMMFRLFLADLFVHGIGGAVYDELTDRIFFRFWDVKLPRFAIVTATLRLPWQGRPVDAATPRQLKQTLRSLQWNPDRFVTESLGKPARDLKQEKLQLIASSARPEELAQRHERYESIRSQLAPFVAGEKDRLDSNLSLALQQLKKDEHLFSREHPWVLYPEESLQRLINSQF